MKRLTIKMNLEDLLLLGQALDQRHHLHLEQGEGNSISAGVCLSLYIKFRKKAFIVQDSYSFKLLEYQARSILDAIQTFWARHDPGPLQQSILSQYSTFLNKHLT